MLVQFLDWFICLTDPKLHWKYQPTYLISQGAYMFGALATLIHGNCPVGIFYSYSNFFGSNYKRWPTSLALVWYNPARVVCRVDLLRCA